MKVATLYRKDGKVILETDNDALAQAATDSPQDVVVMDAYERMAARHLADARQVGRPAALAAPYGQNVPPHGMVAGRIDAAILGRAMVKHQLWEKGDAGLPTVLTDRNGDVVLGMCRVCGQAEGDLADVCPARPADPFAGIDPTVVALLWEDDGPCYALKPINGLWNLTPISRQIPPGHDWRVPVMRPQPAPAIDLGPFRELLNQWKGSEYPLSYEGQHSQRALNACIADLQALIDGQASPHPEGTPMMPAGQFFDGCWKLAPEGVRHHARMLTQSWRAADSSELKRALEAGVLALIDGQAECATCSTTIKPHPMTGTICDCAPPPAKGEEE